MAEYVREARLSLHVDTNKQTVRRNFASVADLLSHLRELADEGLAPFGVPDTADVAPEPGECVYCDNFRAAGKSDGYLAQMHGRDHADKAPPRQDTVARLLDAYEDAAVEYGGARAALRVGPDGASAWRAKMDAARDAILNAFGAARGAEDA